MTETIYQIIEKKQRRKVRINNELEIKNIEKNNFKDNLKIIINKLFMNLD